MSAVKSQASLEFVLLLAGYFAFLAVLSSAAASGFNKSVSIVHQAVVRDELRTACFSAGIFSLDGKRTFAEGRLAGFVAPVGRMALENGTESCFADSRVEGSLKIRTGKEEQR
ncbi:TPA: hypothetical protein HA244_06630 [Candidatus Micrarchaeota archaeon]|nr:hypothetical protein [Candidatus Micrarchaeota archaeon]